MSSKLVHDLAALCRTSAYRRVLDIPGDGEDAGSAGSREHDYFLSAAEAATRLAVQPERHQAVRADGGGSSVGDSDGGRGGANLAKLRTAARRGIAAEAMAGAIGGLAHGKGVEFDLEA